MQVDFHLSSTNMEQYAGLTVEPRRMLLDLDARVKREGWEMVKKGLIALIKGCTVSGCLFTIYGDYGRALQNLRWVVKVIEEANKIWADVPFEVRGYTYMQTYLRGVRVRLMGE